MSFDALAEVCLEGGLPLGSALQIFEPTSQSNLAYSDVPNGRPRRVWDPHFDEILKAGAAAGPSKLRRAIDRIKRLDPRLSEEQIRKRTAELHLTRWSAPWTQEEVDFVLERAREFAVADIARELGRTPKGVYVKLWKIRISARFQDGYTQGELVQALHISRRKLRRWISLGWLTLYERRIKDRALVRFLEEHSKEIDVARLDKDFRLWLRSLGLQESETCSRRLPKTVLQSLKVHTCGRCGRKVNGNAIHVHMRACIKKGPASGKCLATGISIVAAHRAGARPI